MKQRTKILVSVASVFFIAFFLVAGFGGYFLVQWYLGTQAITPIPQVADYQAQLATKHAQYIQSLYLDSFLKIGKRDPKWDKPALAAVEAASKFFIDTYDPPVPLADVFRAAHEAIDLGCDDPLILHLHAYASAGKNDPGHVEWDRRWTVAHEAIVGSQYPAEIRFTACERAGLMRISNKEAGQDFRMEARDFLDEAMTILPTIMETDDAPRARQRWYDSCRSMRRWYEVSGLSKSNAYKRIDRTLAQMPKRRAQRLIHQACQFIDKAWDARGSGYAHTVTEGGMDGFFENLLQARNVLEESWQLDPADPKSATLMIQVEVGIGQTREDMEKWFDRAMRADPDNISACQLKMNWLEPKWHGSVEELRKFGRACRETQNWSSGIPLLVANSHHALSCATHEMFPSVKVAKELIPTFETYLQHKPNDNAARSELAYYYYIVRRLTDAHQQFTQLGSHLKASDRITMPTLEYAAEECNTVSKK